MNLEQASPGLFRHIAQQLHRARGYHAPQDADGVERNVALAQQFPDFVLVETAIIVAAVGKDYQRSSRVLPLLHMVHRKVDRIEQRRPPHRSDGLERALNVVGLGGEPGEQFRLVIKGDQEVLVAGY